MTTMLEIIEKYRYCNKNTLTTILIFIIYPLGAVPLLIKGMIKNERWAFFLWAIFMGVLGILYPPTGDLYRYTADYLNIKVLNWTEFKTFLLFKQDLLLPYLSYGIGKLGLNFDLSRFLYNFVSYWLLGLIYLDITNSNHSFSKKNAILFLGTFMVFSIGTYTIRFSFSIVLFAYGAYQVFYKNNKSGWVFVIISVLNHLSFIVFALVLLVAQLKVFKFSKTIIIILVLLSFTVDSQIMIKLMSFLPIDIINHYSIYMDGYWAGEFLNDHSFLYRIQNFLVSLISYIAAFIYIITYNKQSRTTSLVNGILLLCTLVTPFVTIATRFAGVLLLFIKIQFLVTYKKTPNFHKLLVIFFCVSIFSNMLGLWGARRQIGVSDIKKIAYCSLPTLLTHTYSETWINANVFENGDFKHK